VAVVPTATTAFDMAAGNDGAVDSETAVAETTGSNLGIWLLGGGGLAALLIAFAWFRRR